MQAHQLIACRVHAHNLRPMYALIDFSAIQTPAQPGDANAALRVAFGAPCEVLKTHELHQVKAVLEAVEQRARAGQWCVGYVCYEAAPAFDSALTVHPATGSLVWFGVHDAPLPSDPALQKADPLLSSATTTPPLAEPSTLVTTRPVTLTISRNTSTWA